MQQLSTLPITLEVSSLPDLLWSVAVLLPQLLNDRASEGSPPQTLCLGLLLVCFSHVAIWVKWVERRMCCVR